MSNNTGRVEVAAGQNQKEVTINDADGRIDAAITEFLTSDYTSGDVTLTDSQFQQAVRFVSSNLSVARALNLPEVKKLFIVDNTAGTAALTVTQGTTTIVLPIGGVGIFYTDGTANGLVRPNSLGALTLSGILSVDDATEATSTTVASIQTDGGISAVKQMIAGGGILLGGVAAANLLDDYEEGTFTPTFVFTAGSGTITYNQQFGGFTKVGNLVNFRLQVQMTSKASRTGNVSIGGLPFTVDSEFYIPGVNMELLNIAAGQVVGGRIDPSGTEVGLRLWDSTNGTTPLLDTEVIDTSEAIITGQYMTTS